MEENIENNQINNSLLEEIKEEEIVTKSSRFEDAIWKSTMTDEVCCIIGGVGNIGSWLTLFLSRLDSTISVVDPDVIEIQNIGGQLYPESYVGRNKVNSIKELSIFLGGGKQIYPIKGFIHNDTPSVLGSVDISKNIILLFSCFDNMKARRNMFAIYKVLLNSSKTVFLIDGRSQAEYYQIFTVTENTKELYEEKYLFSDEEASDAPCNYKSTTHCGAQLASNMLAIALNLITNLKLGHEINTVPFFTEVNLKLMDFKFNDK